MGVLLIQIREAIKHTWLILDLCSTNSVSNSTGLVKKIATCKNHEIITVSTNGGLKDSNKEENLKLFLMTVHFNKNYMAKILSFKEVVDIPGVRITMDTNQERAMTVTMKM